VLTRVREMMQSIGKLPVVCGPAPGYIVPRLQALIMNEAPRMVDEGIASAEEIDEATRYGLGLRFAALGVVEFIDVGGCDILHCASPQIADSMDAGRYETRRLRMSQTCSKLQKFAGSGPHRPGARYCASRKALQTINLLVGNLRKKRRRQRWPERGSCATRWRGTCHLPIAVALRPSRRTRRLVPVYFLTVARA